VELLGVVAVVAVCGGLMWVATRIEPHWVSKDGRRFLCNAQQIDLASAQPTTRWHETRVIVGDAGDLQVDQKRFPLRRSTTFWRVEAESPDPPRGKALFLLRGHDATGQAALLAIRVPRSSRAVAVLRTLPRTGRPTTPRSRPVAPSRRDEV